MAERFGSSDPGESCVEILNSEYKNNPGETTAVLAYIALIYEETTGTFLSVDKKD